MNLQKFQLLQTEVNNKPLYKQKMGFAGHEVQVNKTKSMNITSNTNYPGNGTRKLVEEVVPPQLVAGEGSSSAWAG